MLLRKKLENLEQEWWSKTSLKGRLGGSVSEGSVS